MQRTPSAPLMRKPLGDRKPHRLRGPGLLAGLILASGAACSHTTPPAHKPPAVAQSPDVLFEVVLAGTRPYESLSGVEVSLIAGDGRVIPVGKTFAGQIRVSKAKIREVNATLVLFCGQFTFCGAVLVHQPTFSILDFDEYHLE